MFSVTSEVLPHLICVTEEAALEQYEHSCALEEAEIEAAVRSMYGDAQSLQMPSSVQSQVLCPACKSNWLLQADGDSEEAVAGAQPQHPRFIFE